MTLKHPVSVIIPCYRCALTLQRAVDSIANQSKCPAQIILVDDASGDETWAEVNALQRANPGWLEVIQLPANQGAANARNAGWASATQPYIAFLDSDDAWHPRKLEIQLAHMQANPEVMLSGHGHRMVTSPRQSMGWPLTSLTYTSLFKWRVFTRNQIITPSIMVRSTSPIRFPAGQRYMEDQRLLFDLASAGYRIDFLDAELAGIFKPAYGATGLSSHQWAMEAAELANYRSLYTRGKLSLPAVLGLCALSMAKFVRRLVKVKLS